MSSGDGNVIQLDAMSLDQLDNLKQQQEARLQQFTSRYAQLRQAAARLSASATAVKELATASASGDNDEKDGPAEVFVPLTESVYITGTIPAKTSLSESELLVELGTGYYVEQNADSTVAFLDRKMKIVDANSDNVTQAVQSTRQNLESIAMAMRGKMVEIQARQQGARHRAEQEG